MKIKFLSESTINKIAAGEVIERPASVVKELVENAIDAGATKIDIVLEQAGKNLIKISDNGIGMSKEALQIAILRHTTSKLDETDLLNIHTFGFRGEALPSIASISKMLISSRTVEDERAFQIQLAGSSDAIIKPILHDVGTTIEIRDLFFATPARLKFLRSDRAELAACVDSVKKIALAYPDISFNLRCDDKNLIKVKKSNDNYQLSLEQRVTDIIGKSFVENASLLDLRHNLLSINGYVSIPTMNKAAANEQFFFVNNRAVRDKILNTAIRLAYNDYLAKDRHPMVVIFIKIDPQLVDVNVHPAKSEVRFYDPNLIRNLLVEAIKDALSVTNHQSSTTIATAAINSFITPAVSNKNIENQHFAENARQYNHSSNFKKPQYSPQPSFDQRLITTEPLTIGNANERKPVEHATEHIIEEPNLTSTYPLGAAKTQLHSTYIVSQTEDSIIIVDQHAAHERLGYEEIKKNISQNGLIKQRMLIPEIIELDDPMQAEQLFEHKEALANLGLTIEKFGDRSIIVSEIPSIIGDVNIKKLINDIVEHINDSGTEFTLSGLISHITETYACHYAIRAGRKLSLAEMNELLRQMEKTPFSGQCNHGRPTYIELKLKDIEKLFGRR